jgi:four helix bundle protein
MPEKLPAAESFEELWIWQQARMLVRDVYLDFGDGSAAERDFGFRNQIQRAAVSIMNNIAEGFERHSSAEFARFLDVAKASCGEVRSMYYTAEDLRYVAAPTATKRRESARQLSAAIWKLAAHIRG